MNCNLKEADSVTNSMKQRSPWKANHSSASPAFARISRSIDVYQCFTTAQHFFFVPSQIYPVHALRNDLFKIHFNIILPSTPRFSKWSLFFRFSHWNLLCTSHMLHRWKCLEYC